MKAGPARLLFPALRWSADGKFVAESLSVEQGLRGGVGGFIIFGGPVDEVAHVTEQTQSRCDYALLFGSDMERGAGQQFNGATQLPPLAALGYLDNTEITHRAGALTAREARAAGVNLAFAPDADLDIEPRNPIVGTRSFGSTAALVARHVEAWVHGCHAGGALACAKHFPGHGRTTEDSHATLPHVAASRAMLDNDLEPFRAAIAAGVDAIMTAHVVYEQYDALSPATLSTAIATTLLRQSLHFDGLVVTDGLGMQGILDACGGDEARAAIAAVNAGCDVLLYPWDEMRTIDAMNAELGRSLESRRVSEACERIARAADRVAGDSKQRDDGAGDADLPAKMSDGDWALDVALKSIHSLSGTIDIPRNIDVITIDDDLGGPFAPPSRDGFITALRARGFDPREAKLGAMDAKLPAATVDRNIVVALYSDIRAWKGAPGLSADARSQLAEIMAIRSDAVIVLFGHPRLAEELRAQNIVVAWGGEDIMQRAAAAWLAHASGRA